MSNKKNCMVCHNETDQIDLNYRMECKSCEQTREAKENAQRFTLGVDVQDFLTNGNCNKISKFEQIMNRKDTLSKEDLTSIINSAIETFGDGRKFPPAKTWIRIDVGDMETYVGNSYYIVSIVVNKKFIDMDSNEDSPHKTVVVKYLRSEGFVGDEYFYLGITVPELPQEN